MLVLFQPPAQLTLPNFKGCIELETLNEDVLSLYNFERIFSLNTTEEKPCGRSVSLWVLPARGVFSFENWNNLGPTVIKPRSKPALTQAWVNDAAYFDGTGFAQINFGEESARMQRFEQEVKLLSHNGILLLLHNGVKRRGSVHLRDWRSELSFDLSLFSSIRISFCAWRCFRADSRSTMTLLGTWWNWNPKILHRNSWGSVMLTQKL